MNHCQKCNAELPAKASFCGKCGFSQSNEVRSADEVLKDQVSGLLSPMAMQNGHVPMHIMAPKHQKQRRRNKEPGFWITISLMVCLIGGLGAYIISTYISNPVSSATHVVPPSGNAQPALSLQGLLSATIKQGQTLILHGERFKTNDPISFLLDSSIPIKEKNNKIIAVQASSMGRFDVPILIQGSDWSAGPHYIQAVDNRVKQDAYLNIVVSPISTPEVTSQNLALSMQDTTVKKLTFHAVVGQGNPDQQRVTITNTSGSALHWTATANADRNLDWLVIDDNHIAGNLSINGTDSIGISTLITALKSNLPANPYTGQIVFTINGKEQLILPIELQITDAQPEIVFNPNPAIAVVGAGNTCQATTFTLINLGNAFINWTLVPYEPATKNHIQFITNGQPVTQGQLAISGIPGDTQLLSLQCKGVSAGNTYKFTMYAGTTSWLVTIFIK